MKIYKDLTGREKELFRYIEGQFLSSKANVTNFRNVLNVLVEKYKRRSNGK